MCGRLDQNDIPRLLNDFAWAIEYYNRSQAAACYNVAPGTRRPIMHLEDGKLLVDDLHWGYVSAFGAQTKKIPMAINSKLEKLTGRYWAPLLKRGRAIVPANGWYEWTGEPGKKQPWHIHRVNQEPIYMAALANFAPASEYKATNGFTIVTADAEGGMVDVHDRRPIVFTAADTRLWMDPDLAPEQAEQLARSVALGPEAFEWFMVDRAVGNVRNQGPHLAVRLPELEL